MARRGLSVLVSLGLLSWAASVSAQAGGGSGGGGIGAGGGTGLVGGAGRGGGGGGAPGAGGGGPAPNKTVELPKAPETLEEMLAVALRSNPEVLQSEAKLRIAQANLNQTRLRVTQQVISGFHERQKQIEILKLQEHAMDNAKARLATGVVSQESVLEPMRAASESRAALAQIEAQTRYTLGLGGSLTSGAGSDSPREAPAPERRRNSFRADIIEALGKEVSVSFTTLSIGDVLTSLKDLSGGKLHVLLDTNALVGAGGVTLEMSRVPLRTVLEALADMRGICFVFRDYGVLVTTPERAATMMSPVIPEETPLRAQ